MLNVSDLGIVGHITEYRCMIDFSRPMGSFTEVPAGDYLLVEIKNPYGFKENILVIAGTMVGMAQDCWEHWPQHAETRLWFK